MIDETDLIAARLVDAHRRHIRIEAVPDSGPADANQAYAVQRAVWRALAGAQRPSAWKIGAAAPDAEPFAAPVLPERLGYSPARLPARLFAGLAVEAEVALRFGRPLPARAEPYSRAEILAAVASAHVAMEIVDSRLADAKAAGPLWRLADNQVNGALVVGSAIPGWRALDWSAARNVRLEADGRQLDRGPGRPPLGELFLCLPWWIAHVGGICEGDIVTTGAWTGAHPVGPAGRLMVEIESLGAAVVELV
ncbi:hydratase [Parasulfuritortus cantonensis]|uniref:Hydratase n=1 Tax=Parasulfuritortus cantonensis TaxID=2528202 RepID=A0A4R1BKT8_9PROT|nr:fumarylacetoacetate hydrolase family protein [Parasulfuritortus cantonensis]TCJ18010.1 hydratase [Parasulfuritortus cantonensis]